MTNAAIPIDKPAIFSSEVNLFFTSFLSASLKCLNLIVSQNNKKLYYERPFQKKGQAYLIVPFNDVDRLSVNDDGIIYCRDLLNGQKR